MSTTRNYHSVTESKEGDLSYDLEAIKTIAIATATTGTSLLLIICLICRCCFGRKKSPKNKIYDETNGNTENQMNDEYHEYVDLTGTLREDINETPEDDVKLKPRSLPFLDLDLDPDDYLSARPSGYFDKLPPPPSSWVIPKTSEAESKSEVTSVDTTSTGVSVTIKKGKWHKIIDIKFA